MPSQNASEFVGLFARARVVSEISRMAAKLFPWCRRASDPERMARRDLRTPAAPIDLIEGLRDGQLQLPGVPGTSQLFAALLPPRDLQTEAVEAECPRRLGQLLIAESVSRFLRPAPGAERLDASCSGRRGRSPTRQLRIPFIEIALVVVRSPKRSRARVSSHESSSSMDHADG
jgi:hypothetical protein